MENQLLDSEVVEVKDTSSLTTKLSENNTGGKITEFIGKGEDAKNTFIYLTLTWAFRTGICITILIFINGWIFRQNEKVPDVMGEVSSAWDFIIPLVTLSLGYAFGKSKT